MSCPRVTGPLRRCLILGLGLILGIDAAQAADSSTIPLDLAMTAPTIQPVPETGASSSINAASQNQILLAQPALPVNSTTNGPLVDASNQHKFYTFSAELRETYDDNVNTTEFNRQSALETTLSPSVLVAFPMENTSFSAVYTFNGTYYEYLNQGGGENLQYSQSLNATLTHDFSGRFSLNASDSFNDSPEPNLFGTTGTPYRNGQNISNAFSAGLSSQWTPIIGTQTTYGNTLVRYSDPDFSASQDSMENNASETVSFSVVPTISVNFGGVFDTLTYDQSDRGYTSYSGFVGTSWEALPNVNTSIRGGGSYTETPQIQADGSSINSTTVSPYVDLNGSWQIGERSSLSGDYSHEITPSDNSGANGQESDRVSSSFSYTINPQLSTHLQLSYTYSDISGALLYQTSQSSYTETVYAVDVGASYNFIKFFSFTFDITESGVSSGLPDSNYTRDQVAFGIRGTY